MDKNRKYMIVTKRHEGIIKEALLFWGHLTSDKEKRSFGGYTVDVNKSERYTKEELEKFRNDRHDNKQTMPFYSETDDPEYYIKYYDLLATIEDLQKLGYKLFNIMVD